MSPMKYYHATSEENVESILQEGLRPCGISPTTDRPIKPTVFLAISPFWAAMYGGGDSVILVVSVKDRSLLKRSHLGDPSHERLYYGRIGPEDLEVLGDADEYL